MRNVRIHPFTAFFTAIVLLLASPALADALVDNVNGYTIDEDGRLQRFTGMVIDDEGRVKQLAQSVEACAFGQAAAALMGAAAIGRNAGDVRLAPVPEPRHRPDEQP